MGNIAQSCK